MGIFKRISDIISANMNELTEQFENPEKMLKQAIREMEDSIAEVTQQTAKTMAHEKTFSRELQRNRAGSEEWQQRAVKAVEAGDDALARKALTRKNEHETLVAALEDQIKVAGDGSTMLQHQLAGMQAKLAEAKRNLSTLSIRKRSADLRKKMDAQAAGLASQHRRHRVRKVRPAEGQGRAGRGRSRGHGRAAGRAGRWQGRRCVRGLGRRSRRRLAVGRPETEAEQVETS